MRKDEIDSFIVPTTIEIADHFSVKRDYVVSFCRLIRSSMKWTIETMPQHLNFIESKFALFPNGGKELVAILKQAFSYCKDKTDINKLRGSLTEGLLLGTYEESIMNSKTFGWGANVIIKKGNRDWVVKYRCPFHDDEAHPKCTSRQTIDLGIWDGSKGEFFECKVRPDNIDCPEMSYMKLLKKELDQQHLKYNLYFVTTDTLDSMEMKIKEKHPDENFFNLLSLQEISA
ncbi:hypothetical protein [Bacillus licheniformis]|uniref:hypothetical protein n=1 Tax=Bacillus licheniformis TaxID=1402 RepID=UPI0011AA0165|nr:hypothetical protein [Bacillus licheniformis]MED1024620.1 hypothetical protein [Bacillus licheniformis]MED1033028.1 hypothetical protein [Bacillus licheniformis]MED1102346.1 hypothetical protein [Bacillus licheniformis]MED1142351.1 hypothetical protein [Bacillus licheniformis]